MANLTQHERITLCEDYINTRNLNNWHVENTKTLFVFYTIKGYHAFRNRPLVGARMILNCLREPENQYSPFAVKVVAPEINLLQADLLDIETKRGQTVRDIAGNMIGRVPQDLSRVVSEGLANGHIRRASAIYYGEIEHGGVVRGGGPSLKCVYVFEIQNNRVENLRSKIVNIAANHNQ